MPSARSAGSLFAAAACLFAAGCASPRPPASVPASPPVAQPTPSASEPAAPVPPSASPGTESAPEAAPAAARLWGIPESELSTRRLYRVHYEGPEGEGSFRLTLELSAADEYRARAVDLLGRPLWNLSLLRADGLWVDHRAEIYCRVVDRLELAGLPLAPFPLAVLPPLLLGRLPEPPAAGRPPRLDGGRVELIDASGRRWTATLAESAGGGEEGGARLARWSLWGEPEGSPPVLTWLRAGNGEAVLSDRPAGVQLRWREVVSQPLTEPPAEAELPAAYRQVECREAYDAAGI